MVLKAAGLVRGWRDDVVGMGSAAAVMKMSHLSRNWVVIKCHRGAASWWDSSQFPVKSPQNPPPPSCPQPCLLTHVALPRKALLPLSPADHRGL